jgi:O-antigen ligase
MGIFISALLFMLGIGTGIEEGRLTLFGQNPNSIGLFSVFSVLFIISTVFENKQNFRNSRYWLLTFTVPLIYMAAQTGSRTTFLGLFFTLALYFVLKSKTNFSIKLISLLLGGITMYALYSFFMTFDVLRERMISFYTEGNISGRDVIWSYIVPKIMEKPILGVGINGYTKIIGVLYGKFFSPHNVFIELFAYSGILGLLAFLLFVFQILKEGYYRLKNENFVLPILYIFLILFVFLSGQALAVKLFWIIYAYLVNCGIEIPETPEIIQ